MERPTTANSIKGKQIDMKEFYSSVIQDLQMICDRINLIEQRLDLQEIIKIPPKHMKLRSLRI